MGSGDTGRMLEGVCVRVGKNGIGSKQSSALNSNEVFLFAIVGY